MLSTRRNKNEPYNERLEEMENARRELEKGQEKPVSQKMFKAI